MVKKRKKRKPKKRPRSRAAAGASGSLGAAGEASSPSEAAGDAGGPGLAARGLLLDALRDSTPRPPDLDDVGSSPGAPDLDEDAPRPTDSDDEAARDGLDAEADEDAPEDDQDDAPEHKLPSKPVQIPLMGQEAERPVSDEDEDDEDEDEDEGEEDDDDEVAAAQMGAARYVIFGFFALWLVSAYVGGQALMTVWGYLTQWEPFTKALPAVAAVPHEGELVSRTSVSLVLGALIAGGVVLRYYTKSDVRQWADEVAEQLSKVKWPTRKEVGQNTVVVLAVSAVLTTILALLDRFWGFVTNLIYASGL